MIGGGIWPRGRVKYCIEVPDQVAAVTKASQAVAIDAAQPPVNRFLLVAIAGAWAEFVCPVAGCPPGGSRGPSRKLLPASPTLIAPSRLVVTARAGRSPPTLWPLSHPRSSRRRSASATQCERRSPNISTIRCSPAPALATSTRDRRHVHPRASRTSSQSRGYFPCSRSAARRSRIGAGRRISSTTS
jgi:hypothetical protein